jgi:homoserine kinase type II
MDKIKHILDLFTLGQIKQVKDVPSSGNVLFDIESESGNYFLRFNPSGGPRWRSREEVQAEIELIDKLKEEGFPVVTAIPTQAGKRVVELDSGFGYLRRHINGKAKQDPSITNIEEVGELLGWMHTITQGYNTTQQREHRWDLESAKKVLSEKRQIMPIGVMYRLEREYGKLKLDADLPAGMIHEDLGKRHVLWNKEDIAGMIDFDRSYHGPLVLDIGQTARGWCFDGDWEQWNQEKFKALLRGYQSKRQLTEKESEALTDSIRFALLERAQSFLLRSIEKTHDPEDKDFSYQTMNLLAQLKST